MIQFRSSLDLRLELKFLPTSYIWKHSILAKSLARWRRCWMSTGAHVRRQYHHDRRLFEMLSIEALLMRNIWARLTSLARSSAKLSCKRSRQSLRHPSSIRSIVSHPQLSAKKTGCFSRPCTPFALYALDNRECPQDLVAELYVDFLGACRPEILRRTSFDSVTFHQLC